MLQLFRKKDKMKYITFFQNSFIRWRHKLSASLCYFCDRWDEICLTRTLSLIKMLGDICHRRKKGRTKLIWQMPEHSHASRDKGRWITIWEREREREREVRAYVRKNPLSSRGLWLKMMPPANYDKPPPADVCKVHVGPCDASSDLRGPSVYK
jgi:hypothetical protein